MRCLALLTTSFGILLHALLGWCPQHLGCAQGGVDSSLACGHHHHQCAGHRHEANQHHHGSPPANGQLPADSEQHPGCDHADCLFVSQAESVQGLDSSIVGGDVIHHLPGDDQYAVKLAERRKNSASFFLPCSQGQSARIARCVWLI